jgi:beta-glucanase (GH16 family)
MKVWTTETDAKPARTRIARPSPITSALLEEDEMGRSPVLRSLLLLLLSPSAVAASVSTVAPTDGFWRLTFSDEFEILNASSWNVAGGGTHGANELQLYTGDEVSVQDGKLSIRTRWNPMDCVPANGSAKTPGPSDGHAWCLDRQPAPAGGGAGPAGTQRFNFTSGWMDTEQKFAQRFGRFSVRAKLPNVQATNIWPAHWLVPDQSSADCKAGVSRCACCWPVGGEIDIMESCAFTMRSRASQPFRGRLRKADLPLRSIDGNSTPGKDTKGNVFGTYHWANQSGKDLHCGGPSPKKRCDPYQFSGRYPCDH